MNVKLRWTLRALALAVTPLACNRDAGSDADSRDLKLPYLDHAQFAPIKVASEVVSSHPAFGSLGGVRVVNDTALVVFDEFPPFIHLLARSKGALLKSFGDAGQGPGEFTSADDLASDPASTNYVWIYDHIRRRIHRFNLRALDSAADSVVTLMRVPPLESPVWLSDSIVAGLAKTDSAALAIWNRRSDSGRTLGAPIHFTSIALEKMPQPGRSRLAGDFRGCYEPSNSRFVRVHRYGAIVDFVSAVNGATTRAQTPFGYDPAVLSDVGIGGALNYFQGEADQRVSYMGCATTPDFILALFSGRRRGSYPTADGYLSKYIHVFSWTGALLTVLELDEPIIALSIDPRTLELYGVRRHPVPMVFKFKLAATLGALRR